MNSLTYFFLNVLPVNRRTSAAAGRRSTAGVILGDGRTTVENQSNRIQFNKK